MLDKELPTKEQDKLIDMLNQFLDLRIKLFKEFNIKILFGEIGNLESIEELLDQENGNLDMKNKECYKRVGQWDGISIRYFLAGIGRGLKYPHMWDKEPESGLMKNLDWLWHPKLKHNIDKLNNKNK